LFLNTPIRRSQEISVTAKRPLLVVQQGFPGKAGNLVGEFSLVGVVAEVVKVVDVVDVVYVIEAGS
jgi:hypothetical protein